MKAIIPIILLCVLGFNHSNYLQDDCYKSENSVITFINSSTKSITISYYPVYCKNLDTTFKTRLPNCNYETATYMFDSTELVKMGYKGKISILESGKIILKLKPKDTLKIGWSFKDWENNYGVELLIADFNIADGNNTISSIDILNYTDVPYYYGTVFNYETTLKHINDVDFNKIAKSQRYKYKIMGDSAINESIGTGFKVNGQESKGKVVVFTEYYNNMKPMRTLFFSEQALDSMYLYNKMGKVKEKHFPHSEYFFINPN